jgi:sigma-54 dependent transcriptional regulator, acetoin dehydrogenase operon transcriptional activator AcoR
MTHSMTAQAPHDQRMLEARRQFFDRGDWPNAPAGELPRTVLRSWQRCRDSGLDYQASGRGDPEGRSQLSQARERSDGLLRNACGIMEHVFEQIRASGSMVVLSDDGGMILHSLGDPGFFTRAQRVALQPGASWNESLRGTNAIGTALVEGAPVEVAGAEHFLDRNGILTCSAAPVYGPDGDLIGVLDISAEYHASQRQTHTLGLVRLAAQLLERRLFEERFVGEILIGVHSQPDGVGGPQEGMLALSSDGAVVGANSVARSLFARDTRGMTGKDFGNLFKLPFGTFMDRLDRASSAPLEIETRGGHRLHVRLRSAPAMRVGPVPANRTNRAERTRRTNAAPANGRITLDCLATGDPRLQLALDRAARITGKDIPLLIQGESGVGKELFARAFHVSGPRRDGPFVAVNCAAIPETLIESELFGYVGGAFTGARREGSVGRIQQAHGGTLFLDEIGDMPLSMQARLLRVLQERSVSPVGAQHQIPVDISLVCATHRILSDAIRAGSFREDLYYRVNGLTVTLPALRDRSDIRAIATMLLEREMGDGENVSISEEVLQLIERHPWPGNVRQLQNLMRVAMALLDDGETVIRLHHLPEDMLRADPIAPESSALRPASAQIDANPMTMHGRSLDEIKR